MIPQTTPPRSAYVHIPFCAHRCGYCDFASVAGRDERVDQYLTALEAEMAAKLREPIAVETLFVGGGTPTYMSAGQLQRLLERLRYWFTLEAGYEFTVESNPNTLDGQKVRLLADHGVNRVSLGAQSFHPQLLLTLERNHDPASVGRAVELLDGRIGNYSIDLIFGVPGQDFETWRGDLEQALTLAPSHLSTYGLTYEKGTRLWKQRELGQIRPIDEELERRMYEWALDRLVDAGMAHYEISNFARIDQGAAQVCRHNLAYWANDPYYGFGTGAAAYVAGERTLNTRELDAYIDRCLSGRSPVTQCERLEDLPRARETAFVNLRRRAGIVRDEFQRRTGFAPDPLFNPSVEEFVDWGLLEDDGSSIRLTRQGLPVADSVLQSLL